MCIHIFVTLCILCKVLTSNHITHRLCAIFFKPCLYNIIILRDRDYEVVVTEVDLMHIVMEV
jgi:hypothetical protein